MSNYHRSTSFANRERQAKIRKQQRRLQIETYLVVGLLIATVACLILAYYGAI